MIEIEPALFKRDKSSPVDMCARCFIEPYNSFAWRKVLLYLCNLYRTI